MQGEQRLSGYFISRLFSRLEWRIAATLITSDASLHTPHATYCLFTFGPAHKRRLTRLSDTVSGSFPRSGAAASSRSSRRGAAEFHVLTILLCSGCVTILLCLCWLYLICNNTHYSQQGRRGTRQVLTLSTSSPPLSPFLWLFSLLSLLFLPFLPFFPSLHSITPPSNAREIQSTPSSEIVLSEFVPGAPSEIVPGVLPHSRAHVHSRATSGAARCGAKFILPLHVLTTLLCSQETRPCLQSLQNN